MIILSGVLVVVAIALLGAAIVPGIVSGNADSAQVLGVDALVIIYLSIAVSVVSAICLAIGVFLRRKELFGANASAAGRGRKPAQARKATGRTAPAAGRGKGAAGKSGAAATAPLSSQASKVPGDAVVFVVRGRKRYHLATCRQLAGREKEELTYAEAREEGFSSCTACMPDTALAARAAVSVPAGGPAAKASASESASAAKPATASMSKGAPASEPTTASPATSGSGAANSSPSGSAPSGSAASSPAASSSSGARPRPAGEDTPPPGFRADPLEVSGRDSTDLVAGSGRQEAAHTSEAPDAPRPAGDDVSVRILRGTKRYHLPECALLEDVGDDAEDLESLPRSEAKARDCTPCLVCRPE